jgi:hypothetical protein
MPPGSAYNQLLRRVYSDLIDKCAGIASDDGHPDAIVNVLEFQATTESFYNVTPSIPTYTPTAILEGSVPTSPRPSKRRLDDYAVDLQKLLCDRAVVQSIDWVFDDFDALALNNDWMPGVFDPTLIGVVNEWRGWFQGEAASARLGDPTAGRGRCYTEFCELLLALTPQPCNAANAFGTLIYDSLIERTAKGVDLDHFLETSEGESLAWRFGPDGDPGKVLRDLLEVLFLLPIPSQDLGTLLRRVESDASQGYLDIATSVKDASSQYHIAAIGGPMMHLGQVEGLIYISSPWCPSSGGFSDTANRKLKDIAEEAATRLHNVRRTMVRRALLAEVHQVQRDPSMLAQLLVRHVPNFMSTAIAAFIPSPASGVPPLEGACLISRPYQPGRRRRTAVTELTVPGTRELGRKLLKFVTAVMDDAGGDPVCLDTSDRVFRPVGVELANNFRTKGDAASRTACVFRIEPAGPTSPGHIVLLFREPQKTGHQSSYNIDESVHMLALELQELADLVVIAAQASSLEFVLAQVGHVLYRPVTLALKSVARVCAYLQAKDLQDIADEANTAHELLLHVRAQARGAKDFLSLAKVPVLKTSAVDLSAVVSSCHSVLARACTAPITISGAERPVRCAGDKELCEIVVWQLLENAVAAVLREGLKEPTVNVELGEVELRAEGRLAHMRVSNRSRISRAAVRALSRRATMQQRSQGWTSGNSGLGLVYCFNIVRAMGGRISLSKSGPRAGMFTCDIYFRCPAVEVQK